MSDSEHSDMNEYGQRKGQKFYDECNEIVLQKIKKAGEKIKEDILKEVLELGERSHWVFINIYDTYFKEEFRNILQNHAHELFMAFSRNLVLFIEYIGEDQEKLRTELPKFLDLQVKDTYTWNSITEHYYQYLVDYNGKIPKNLMRM